VKKDIENTDDIKFLVDAFYQKVVNDDVIGYFFTEVVPLSWERHLPVMYQFWETILLAKAAYKGNPVKKHLELHQKEPLEVKHFDRWLYLWKATIDEHFSGKVAEEAKKKAVTMKQLMMAKIRFLEHPDAIQ
jgi:hemoglobin